MPPKHLPGNPPSQAAALLLATGARRTRARIDVLTALLRADEALTHHEVERRLRRGHDVDRVTLYRVLEWLTEQGLAHKLAGGDRVWRFSAAGKARAAGGAHAHFECSSCGKVICLDEARLPSIPLPAGYRRRDIEVTIKGRCDQCAA
ncbi:MAG: transcriptional repressor [Pseudomonadota bacterium]|nr:transcriptional repressor [Pseudomonadota bacterium]